MKTEIEQKASFNIMRYAQCWEDADVLIKSLNINKEDVCLSIASAGENSLSLLSESPKKVIAIDMNPIQLYAVELRKHVYKYLEHEEMLKLHGAIPSNIKERTNIYSKIKPYLSTECAQYWKQTKIFESGYGSVGKFEHYFKLFKDKVIPLIHSKKQIEKLFSCKTIEEQKNFYRNTWNNWRWRLLFKLFFSRKIMGLMGRDAAFFKYVEGSVADKILSRTEIAFDNVLAKDNPYLDWILHGEFKHSLPHALRKENFDKIKQNIDKLELHLGSIESYLSISKDKITKYNLSDIFEYMSEEKYKELMELLIKASKSGGKLAYWNMLSPRYSSMSPDLKNIVTPVNTNELFLKDKAFFYSHYHCEIIN